MPTLKIVRTRPNHDIEFSHGVSDDIAQILAIRHPHDTVNYILGDAVLARGTDYIFTTREGLDAYLNDPDRFSRRNDGNAYNVTHGTTTRLAVLDGENSGWVKFNSITNSYDVISMNEDEADAWVTELAMVSGPVIE